MTFLWVTWAYLVVGSIVAKIYGRKLIVDVNGGNKRAQRLLRLQNEIGSEKFWSLFYVLTTMVYGLLFVHAVVVMIRRTGNAEMR